MKRIWIYPGYGDTLRMVINNRVFGLFYDSSSRKRHIAEYIPYVKPPNESLCGYQHRGFIATRYEVDICDKCMAALDFIAPNS